MPQFHNITAFVVMSSVAARFFPPQIAGAGATVGASGLPFRIDHDEKFNQTTHIQYTLRTARRGPWGGFNWRYDSGLVAGSAPCYNPSTTPTAPAATLTILNGAPAVDLSGLTADQQFQAGLMCNGMRATPGNRASRRLPRLAAHLHPPQHPRPEHRSNDHNPPRIAPRNLFDVSVGNDNLFNGDRYKWNLDLTAINITNKYTLYNFLSTFSGTHYVSPRALTGKLTLNF